MYLKNYLFVALAILFQLQSFAQDTTAKDVVKEEELRVYPVLWHQLSAEYRALCYQAFNIARVNLEIEIKEKSGCGQLAIVTDLDETILDNSYSEAKNIVNGKSYNFKDWTTWVESASATGVPGAVDFLKWAASQGVAVFYISNRVPSDIPATIKNLEKLDLPFADEDHMLFLADGSTKEPRRLLVAKNYKIVMLLGDNLNDFAACFEVNDATARKAEVDASMQEWGRRFIVLPNAIYGEWEKAFYDYRKGLSPSEKVKARHDKLKIEP